MSQASRRGSTQAPEAGPSTSRRSSSRAVDIVGSDDEDQPRRAKASTSRRKIETHDEDDEDDDDEDAIFGELAQPLPYPQIGEEFRNQPLKKDEATLRLNNLIKEWKEVERKVQASMELLANSAGELQEALANGDEDGQASEVNINTCVVACRRLTFS